MSVEPNEDDAEATGDHGVPAIGTAVSGEGIAPMDRRSRFSNPARRFSPSTFRERRQLLLERTGSGLAILFGAKSILDAWEERRFDPTFRVGPFRQEANLFYLTGLELPGAAATLDLTTGEIQIFLPRPNEAARAELERLELGDPRPLSAFERHVTEAVEDGVAYLVVRSEDIASLRAGFSEESSFPRLLPGGQPHTFPDRRLSARFRARFRPSAIESLLPALLELRRTKDSEEIGAIRDAATTTVHGLTAGISAVAPGVDTREVAAEIERESRRRGAQRHAFSPVIQSGADIVRSFVDVIDSYDGLNRTLEEGELALLDYGAEQDYYVADVARTVPVSGRFSEDQRTAYRAYLRAYRAGLEAIGPGVSFMSAAKATTMAFQDQLPHLPPWLRSAASEFTRAAGDLRPGHFLGLELHDHEEYHTPFRPGEVVAYEHHFRIPRRGWRITVEDMVMVTETGSKVLSDGLPKDPEELETLMASRGGG